MNRHVCRNPLALERFARTFAASCRFADVYPENAKRELDRDLGRKAMAEAGMRVFPTARFHSRTDAIAFVNKNP
ncbi:hypothetical protein [Burkholderia oklahomensis]|uniref:hypothetical protein n=1 Tax=Burkholderia oklahomensis TaxID=342113 RepID=UPI0026581F7C|nr:hypothetical protein [Burkholderia oklahomensis]